MMIAFLYVLFNVFLPVFSQVPPGAPSIDSPDIIVRGETIVFSCTSTGGNPLPTVKWYRDNVELTDGISSTTLGSAVTTTYTFVATLNEHYEVFECQADNRVLQNPLKITKFVYVHYTPDIPVLNGPTSLEAGEPGTWTCTSANGYPAGTMSMKNTNTGTTYQSPEYTVKSTPVNGGRSFTVTGTLNWSPALSNNNHLLCCEVAHPTTITTPQSVCLILAVRAPLAVNAPVTSYTPTIGDSVTIQCVVTSGSATSITWFKGSTQLNIATNSRYSNGDVNNPSLTISGVQQSDAGDYTCRASDGSVTVSTDNINVNPQGTPPVVTIPVNSYQETAGYSITLSCQVSSPNSPLQSVQWTFTNQNGQIIDPIVLTSPKYSGSTTSSPSLTITNVQFSDEGTYRCSATNLIGTTTSDTTAFLDVIGSYLSVTVQPSTQQATIGDASITIQCTIQGSPQATSWEWTKTPSGGNAVVIAQGTNNGKLQVTSSASNPNLIIYNIQSSDAAQYRCRADNGAGQVTSGPSTLTVQAKLAINAPITSYTPTIGSTIILRCVIISGNPSHITWFKGNTELNLATHNRYSNGNLVNPSLTISSVQQSDAGDYTCQGTGENITASSSIINISPQGPQVHQEQSNTTFVAIISALAVALVISIILNVKYCLKNRTAESPKNGQRGRRSIPGTYNTPSGEYNPHFYDVTDTYDKIPGQENISNDMSGVDTHGTKTSSSDYQTPIELYHKYTEVM